MTLIYTYTPEYEIALNHTTRDLSRGLADKKCQ